MDNLTFDAIKHEYKLNGLVIPSVTQILSGSGLVNLDWVSKELLEEKADLGNKVHKTTELYDKGILDLSHLHSTLNLYLQSWIAFRKDYDFSPMEIEPVYFHSTYKFAGRLDRVGLTKGVLSLVDIKSGTHQKTHAIQTAGYKLLYDCGKKPKEKIKKRLIVYLTENNYSVEENNKLTDESVFLSALTIYNYKRGIL